MLFRKLPSPIGPDDEYRESVGARREVIVRAVNREFRSTDASEHAIYAGSHGRNTAIENSDVDLAAIPPDHHYARFNGYSTNGQSALL